MRKALTVKDLAKLTKRAKVRRVKSAEIERLQRASEHIAKKRKKKLRASERIEPPVIILNRD